MKISAVLFDMDGVIISTRQEIENFWLSWAKKANVLISDEDIENYIHGCPPKRTLQTLFPNIDDAFKREMEKDSLRIGKDPGELVVRGLYDFMDELESHLIPFGIVTSHPLESAVRIVRELYLGHRHSVLVTVDQVECGKPHPDPYLLAAERLQLPVNEILVFEDSISGCTSALEAGMPVVGVNTPKYAASLKSLGVISVIEDFTGIKNTLSTLGINLI